MIHDLAGTVINDDDRDGDHAYHLDTRLYTIHDRSQRSLPDVCSSPFVLHFKSDQ